MPLFDILRFPNIQIPSNLVKEANDGFDRLCASLVDKIYSNVLPDLLFKSQTRVFFQAHTRRALMLIEGGYDACLSGRNLVAYACARGVYETVVCVADFCDKLQEHLTVGDFKKTVSFIHCRTFAGRSNDFIESNDGFDYKATNVLTQMQRFSKQLPGVLDDYEFLSELTHPNGLGAVLYFSEEEDIDDSCQVTSFSNNFRPYDAIRSLVNAGCLLSIMDSQIRSTERRLATYSFLSPMR
jgi:hypothetical protein